MIKGLAYIYPNLGGSLGICFEVGVWGVARGKTPVRVAKNQLFWRK